MTHLKNNLRRSLSMFRDDFLYHITSKYALNAVGHRLTNIQTKVRSTVTSHLGWITNCTSASRL